MAEGIRPGIERRGRIALAHTPTAFEPLPGLSRALGGPEIWIKRDDCTGLGLGGNKVRKLEFLVAEARSAGADTLVTIGASQSNHVRLTAAAARATGFGTVSILFPDSHSPAAPAAMEGNILLDHLFGSEMITLPFGLGEATKEHVEAEVERILGELHARGNKPYFIPAGGAVPIGCLGYLRAAEEMAQQDRRKGVSIDTLVLAVGTGGTLAGILLGIDALRLHWKVLGFSVMKEGVARGAGIAPVETLVHEAAALIGYDAKPSRVKYEVSYDHVGEDYGVVSPEGAEAIRLVAKSDGIVLDPVYTGKAMAGLIAMIRSGRIDSSRKVLFLHTGGAPALFAHPEVLTAGV